MLKYIDALSRLSSDIKPDFSSVAESESIGCPTTGKQSRYAMCFLMRHLLRQREAMLAETLAVFHNVAIWF